jgi:DNA-binding beta-propeller fold protein YncE
VPPLGPGDHSAENWGEIDAEQGIGGGCAPLGHCRVKHVRAGFWWGAAPVAFLAAVVRPASADFVNFESGQTSPLALSPDGQWLFALNTPDARPIFAVTETGLSLVAEVPVGLEPVAVAARSATEVWVVNHLSDSVSIVHFDHDEPQQSRVVATLNVSDEPRDVVFASGRAFVTAARRGQHLPEGVEADLTVPGIGRALVWVFDGDDPFADTDFDADADPSPLGGEPLTVLELFGDSPRALAASPDGTRVHAAIFNSGSRTTTLNPWAVMLGGGLPQPPADSPYFDPAYDPTDQTPDLFRTTGLIVKWDAADARFEDELGRDWSWAVRLTLPDEDVFTIDATTDPPSLLGAETASGVGTTIFNMAVRPGTDEVFVTNTEARNAVRFQPKVRGHFAESRISIVAGSAVHAVHLNPHIDYDVATGPSAEVEQSLAPPTDLVFSSDGATLYVAGFGSENVGIFSVTGLETGTASRELLDVGGGPSGLALDEANDRLYVLKRFEQRIAVVDRASVPGAREIIADVGLGFDPSPQVILRGRRFLYDTRLSGHGDGSCASCHIFGDFDGIAWDLGDPYGTVVADPNPFLNTTNPPDFHPMKGPMTTQSLRGLADQGPMHWRRPQRRIRLGRRPARRAGGLRAVQSGVRWAPRHRSADPGGEHDGVRAVRADPALSAEPDAAARQLRHAPGAAAGKEVVEARGAPLPSRRDRHANGQSVDFTGCRWPGPGELNLNGCEGGPALPEPVHQGRHVQQSPAGFEDIGVNPRRVPPRRPDPRLRLLPRRQQGRPGLPCRSPGSHAQHDDPAKAPARATPAPPAAGERGGGARWDRERSRRRAPRPAGGAQANAGARDISSSGGSPAASRGARSMCPAWSPPIARPILTSRSPPSGAWRPAPAPSRPGRACHRGRGGAWDSIATRTARATPTSATPVPIRATRSTSRAGRYSRSSRAASSI